MLKALTSGVVAAQSEYRQPIVAAMRKFMAPLFPIATRASRAAGPIAP